jgi:hypothetical protein
MYCVFAFAKSDCLQTTKRIFRKKLQCYLQGYCIIKGNFIFWWPGAALKWMSLDCELCTQNKLLLYVRGAYLIGVIIL